MAKSEFRMMMSPLTRTMYAGPVKNDGNGYVSAGKRHDVTQDFFRCMVEYLQANDGEVSISGGGERFTFTMKKEPV